MKTLRRGFVLLSVFLFLTMATLLVTQLYYRATTYNSFIPVVIERERAKQIARSGIAIALNQLALADQTLTPPHQKKESEAPTETDPERRARALLKVLLQVQNRWQKFSLQEERDGLEGELSLCITCEEGKIPYGALIDFQHGVFKNKKAALFNGREFFQNILERLEPLVGKKVPLEVFSTFFKELKYKQIAITDLLTLEELGFFKERVFYKPGTEKTEVALADLFTLWTPQPQLHPLILAPSVRVLYDFNPDAIQHEIPPELLEKIVEKFPVKQANWEHDWDSYLQPLYGKDYKNLPKGLSALFSSKFEPRVFSVLCYGKVGRVGQTLLALVARTFTQQGEVFEVKRIYWL